MMVQDSQHQLAICRPGLQIAIFILAITRATSVILVSSAMCGWGEAIKWVLLTCAQTNVIDCSSELNPENLQVCSFSGGICWTMDCAVAAVPSWGCASAACIVVSTPSTATTSCCPMMISIANAALAGTGVLPLLSKGRMKVRARKRSSDLQDRWKPTLGSLPHSITTYTRL